MRFSGAVIAALAAGVMAAPAVKIVEDVITVVETVIVTVDAPAPTPTTSSAARSYGHHTSSPVTTSSTPPPITTSSTPAPEPVTTSSAPSSAPTSSAPASSAPAPSGTTYSDLTVTHHNAHRTNHSAPDLAWDDGLASTAQLIASSCYYAHNVTANGGGYGQNIAAGVPPDNITAAITNLFYNGEVNWFNGLYGQATPDMTNFDSWGHFSQIVWKATTHVGCATQDCTSQGLGNVGNDVAPYFTVCNYAGPGNVGGAYGTNIGEPLGQPSLNWNSFGLVSSGS